MLRVILQWTDIPSRGGVVLFLVTSSYGNWHKLWPDELLSLSTDFTLTKFHTLTRQYYGVTLISMGNKQNLFNTQNLQYKMTQSTIYSRIINRVKMVLVSNFGKMVHCGSCLKLKNLLPTITGSLSTLAPKEASKMYFNLDFFLSKACTAFQF